MPGPPDVGLMRHRVMVQSAVRLPGGAGRMAPTWSDVATYWAHVEPVSGRQAFQAMQVKPTTWLKVRMRTNQPLTVANRLVFQGRNLNIESVFRVDERPGYYEMLCTELAKS